MDRPVGSELASCLTRVRDSTGPRTTSQPLSPPLSREESRDSKFRLSNNSSPAWHHTAMPTATPSPWNSRPDPFNNTSIANTPSKTHSAINSTGLARNSTLMTAPAAVAATSSHLPVKKSHSSPSPEEFWYRYEHLKQNEQAKNALIEELVVHLEALEAQLPRCTAYGPTREEILTGQVRHLRKLMDSNPFVLVLLDGASAPFNPEYYRHGYSGGQRAAKDLVSAIGAILAQGDPDVPTHSRTYVRVYDNMSNYDSALPMNAFISGFNSVADAVEIIDGSFRSTSRVSDSLRHFNDDVHCRRIFFGGASADEHAAVLRELAFTTKTSQLISILVADEAHVDGDLSTYAVHKLGNVLASSRPKFHERLPSATESLWSGAAQIPSDSHPSTSTNSPRRKEDIPPPKTPARAAPMGKTWASTVAKAKAVDPPKLPAPSPAPKPTPSVTVEVKGDTKIPRNKHGQRIDPSIQHNKDEVDRVKRKKLCNVHFLRHECPYGDSCTHVHDYKPNRNELRMLALVARMAPCVGGGACDDAKCMYGHVCPAPAGKDGQRCFFGNTCKFPAEMHGVDRQAVNVVKIGPK